MLLPCCHVTAPIPVQTESRSSRGATAQGASRERGGEEVKRKSTRVDHGQTKTTRRERLLGASQRCDDRVEARGTTLLGNRTYLVQRQGRLPTLSGTERRRRRGYAARCCSMPCPTVTGGDRRKLPAMRTSRCVRRSSRVAIQRTPLLDLRAASATRARPGLHSPRLASSARCVLVPRDDDAIHFHYMPCGEIASNRGMRPPHRHYGMLFA